MKIKFIIFIFVSILAAGSFAQQQSMPGRILLRIKPEAVAAFRSAFASPVIHSLKFDPQKFSLKDNAAIINLFSLPSILHVTSLKPLIPQHNIALEELRERTNPALFPKVNQNGIIPKETEDIAKLRSCEEKISRWFELFFEGSMTSEEAAMLLKKSHIIEVAEPRYRYSLCFTPNDPLFSQQYSLTIIQAPQAWDIVRCDSTMLIADDDIGSDWTHPDLANAIFVNKGETGLDSNGFDKRSNGIDDDGDGFVDDWHGWDFAGADGSAPDNDPNTPATHGTHTAGIMAASGNNGIGICGVAFGAKVLVLKCGDNSGGDVSFGYEGIIYAADRGAKVVNNSWGGTNRTQVGQDIINYATQKNCAVVAAAGNSGIFQDLYPGAYDHVLCVAATDELDRITQFSNFNTHVDLSAPGNNVLSTIPNDGYTLMTGTSMASPNAAGSVALVRQKFPNLTADQAIQRLRVTTDALNSNQDPNPGFSGTGRINVQRAVSLSPIYSARLESVDILVADSNGTLESGEAADIILHVRNYLDPITDLVAKVEYLDTNHYISANTETVNFGKANTLDVVQNFQGSLHVITAAYVPDNYTILVKLTFFSSPEGYGPDVAYFPLIINKGYLDLNKNNLTVTFNARGGIGYNDPPDNTQGSGFLWTNAPPEIEVVGRDILSEAGLMIGTDSDHVVASAPSNNDDNVAEQDFTSLLNLQYVSPTDHQNAIQELHTIFDDENADPNIQAGVKVEQKMYAFTKDLAANAIVLDYVIYKRIFNVSNQTAAALFMDWDIGASGSLNKAYISSLDTMLSITRRIEDLYPFVGIKLISDIPTGAELNFYALDNDGSNGSAQTYGGFSEKWLTMTTPRPIAGIGDVSMVYGLKNLPLLSEDSVRLTFIIGVAESEQLLKQTIDETRNEWFATNAVRPASQEENILRTFPNPFGSRMHIEWKSDNPAALADIELSDAMGRILVTKKIQGNSLDFDRLTLPAGSYIFTVRQDNAVLRSTVISLP